MGVHSGKFGVVNNISTVRNWSINDVSAPIKFVASNTLGGAGRRAGVRSWTGSFSCYGHSPLLLPGQFFSFNGYTAPADDVDGSSGLSYAGAAIVDSVAISWNWATGDIIAHVLNFSGHMILVTESDVYADITEPTVPVVCGTKLLTGNDVIENITQVTLTLTAGNQPFVNSSTQCWTGRRAGPVDWTMSVVQQEVEREQLIIGSDHIIKAYVDDDTFWELKWMHVKDYTGITVDRETGAIISRTVNLEKNGFAGGGIGHCILPDLTQFWPTPTPSSSSP